MRLPYMTSALSLIKAKKHKECVDFHANYVQMLNIFIVYFKTILSN